MNKRIIPPVLCVLFRVLIDTLISSPLYPHTSSGFRGLKKSSLLTPERGTFKRLVIWEVYETRHNNCLWEIEKGKWDSGLVLFDLGIEVVEASERERQDEAREDVKVNLADVQGHEEGDCDHDVLDDDEESVHVLSAFLKTTISGTVGPCKELVWRQVDYSDWTLEKQETWFPGVYGLLRETQGLVGGLGLVGSKGWLDWPLKRSGRLGSFDLRERSSVDQPWVGWNGYSPGLRL